MLRKISLVLLVVTLMVSVIGCSNSNPIPELQLPTSTDTSTAFRAGFGDNYNKYVVDGYSDVCVYTLNEEIVFLIVTANVNEDEFPCYADAFTKEIGGTPIAISTDLRSIVIENADGKFEVSCYVRGIDIELAPSTVANFTKDSNNFIKLIAE